MHGHNIVGFIASIIHSVYLGLCECKLKKAYQTRAPLKRLMTLYSIVIRTKKRLHSQVYIRTWKVRKIDWLSLRYKFFYMKSALAQSLNPLEDDFIFTESAIFFAFRDLERKLINLTYNSKMPYTAHDLFKKKVKWEKKFVNQIVKNDAVIPLHIRLSILVVFVRNALAFHPICLLLWEVPSSEVSVAPLTILQTEFPVW